jgi:hypothetical protein
MARDDHGQQTAEAARAQHPLQDLTDGAALRNVLGAVGVDIVFGGRWRGEPARLNLRTYTLETRTQSRQ